MQIEGDTSPAVAELVKIMSTPAPGATLHDTVVTVLQAWLRAAETVPDIDHVDLCDHWDDDGPICPLPFWSDAVDLAVTMGCIGRLMVDAELVALAERIQSIDESFDAERLRAEDAYAQHLEDETWKSYPWVDPTRIGQRLKPPRGAAQVNLALSGIGLQVRGDNGWLLTERGAKYGDQQVARNTGREYIRWNHEVVDLLGPEHFAPALLTTSEIGAQLTPRLSAMRLNQVLLDLGLQERRGRNGWWLTEKGKRYGVQRGRGTDPQPVARWRQELVEFLRDAINGGTGVV